MNPHTAHSISPLLLWRSIVQHRNLIIQMSKREIIGRYKGSLLGVFWSFVTPLLMLVVFTFVFGEIFQSKWPGSPATGGLDFAVPLFAGFLIYTFFAECISRAPGLITGNVNYVKKVVFPLEILTVVSLIAAIFHLLAGYIILIALILISGWELAWSMLLLPVIFLPFMFMVLGFSWGLAALGVYLRDISHIIGPILMGVMFLSPVFYSLDSVSQKFLIIYYLNPLTLIIEESRSVLLHGNMPDFTLLATYTIISLTIFWLGYAFFQKTRKGFADVL